MTVMWLNPEVTGVDAPDDAVVAEAYILRVDGRKDHFEWVEVEVEKGKRFQAAGVLQVVWGDRICWIWEE